MTNFEWIERREAPRGVRATAHCGTRTDDHTAGGDDSPPPPTKYPTVVPSTPPSQTAPPCLRKVPAAPKTHCHRSNPPVVPASHLASPCSAGFPGRASESPPHSPQTHMFASRRRRWPPAQADGCTVSSVRLARFSQGTSPSGSGAPMAHGESMQKCL